MLHLPQRSLQLMSRGGPPEFPPDNSPLWKIATGKRVAGGDQGGFQRSQYGCSWTRRMRWTDRRCTNWIMTCTIGRRLGARFRRCRGTFAGPTIEALVNSLMLGVTPGQSYMEFAVVEGWRCLLGKWRYQLGSRVPERRGTRVGAFLCSE